MRIAEDCRYAGVTGLALPLVQERVSRCGRHVSRMDKCHRARIKMDFSLESNASEK